MGIPYFMNYVIFFQDDAEYQLAVAAAGGNLIEATPRQAAALFGIPFPYPTGDMSAIPRGIYFVAPWFPGTQLQFPGPSGKFIDDNVLTTVVTAQAGVPASIFPADSPAKDGIFTWSGNITRMSGAGAAASPPLNSCSQRRWAVGREISFEGPSVLQQTISRDASRVIGGHGFMQRGNNNATTWNIPVNFFRAALVTRVSWERFYFRIRAFPTASDTSMWRCHGGPSNSAGAMLQLNVADGRIHLIDIDALNTRVDKGAIFTPNLNQWYRCDQFLRYGSGSPPTVISTYINGTNVSYVNSGMAGMSSNSSHTSSDLGINNGTVDNEVEIDFDDWINADLPANLDSTNLVFNDANFPLDWLLGSHVRVHHGVSVSQVNWAPAGEGVGAANQSQGPAGRLGTSAVTSTTALAILRVTSDMLPLDIQDTLGNVMGAISALVEMYSSTSDGSDGDQGYSAAGAADVFTTVNQQVAESATAVMYQPTGVVLPLDLTPFQSVHRKANNAATDLVAMLIHTVEWLGVWGPEDDPLFTFPISRLSWVHNSRYENTQFGYLGSEPDAPVFAGGFTYAGNGTYQELTLPGPCHFLWIRPLTGGAGGIKFYGASLGAHTGSSIQTIGNVRMWYDYVNQLFKFSVTGAANSECNVSGVNYQVIFFCDPGMRFNCCTAFGHSTSAAVPKINPLIAAGFTPEHGFITQDFNGNAGNLGQWTRGPGHTAQNITPLSSAAIDTTGCTFGVGVVNSFATLHQGNGFFSLSLWRTLDNGGGGCNTKMVQILSYTGNGTSPRNITLTPTSGRVPLFVFVAPASAAGSSFFRDPSHAGTNSSIADSMAISAANGITAVAIDQITVQAGINTNGVVYNIFAICGDTAGMNNGTYSPNYCDGSGPYIPPSLPSTDPVVLMNGGIDFDGTPPLTLLKDVSGIYTLVPGKRNDTLFDRQTGQSSVDVEIPDPTFKTGYIGG